MFVLRRFFAVLMAAGALAALTASAEAGSPCRQGPPSWWFAPKVTYTYSGNSSRTYSEPRYSTRSASTRRSTTRSYSRSRSAHSGRYAHSYGYSHWR